MFLIIVYMGNVQKVWMVLSTLFFFITENEQVDTVVSTHRYA